MTPESTDLTCEDLAARVCAKPRPVMFLDTSAILDIARVAFRPKLQIDILESAAALVEDLSAEPQSTWIVSSSNVRREFDANRPPVVEELKSGLAQVETSVARLARIGRLVVPERRTGDLDWLDTTFSERVAGVMDRLVSVIIFFQGGAKCIGRARDRLWAGLPPASKSKQEFKDCEIFEEFLELARALRDNSFDQRIVFVTSNSRDYGSPPGHPQIETDLAECAATYAGHLAWARAVIQSKGTIINMPDGAGD